MRQRRRPDTKTRGSVDVGSDLSQVHLPETNSSAPRQIHRGSTSSVIPLEDVDITHVDLVGGKGANLGQCLKQVSQYPQASVYRERLFQITSRESHKTLLGTLIWLLSGTALLAWN